MRISDWSSDVCSSDLASRSISCQLSADRAGYRRVAPAGAADARNHGGRTNGAKFQDRDGRTCAGVALAFRSGTPAPERPSYGKRQSPASNLNPGKQKRTTAGRGRMVESELN